ncbi:hypothetical protein CAZ10_09065 [Pseudomonas aeruginosa]|uniref:Uncharacterized protein n=1 Tax=Pseudomonas aeruginosa TaxID=287 RepID=A0A241XR70_PSEAI|nr:hypothetical protein A9513_016000 [Pseudomonas sp. AU12215]OTI62989.1 hypothetical protein CAZ10_09065 [Pseudomonas aeruginosa]
MSNLCTTVGLKWGLALLFTSSTLELHQVRLPTQLLSELSRMTVTSQPSKLLIFLKKIFW